MRPPQPLKMFLAIVLGCAVAGASNANQKVQPDGKEFFFIAKIEADPTTHTHPPPPTTTTKRPTTTTDALPTESTTGSDVTDDTTTTEQPFRPQMQEIIKEASDEEEEVDLSTSTTTTEEPSDAWPVDIAKIREKHAAEPESLDMDEIMAMNLDMECHCLKKRSASGEVRKAAAKYRVDIVDAAKEVAAPTTHTHPPPPTPPTAAPPAPTTTEADDLPTIVRRDCHDGCCCFEIDCPNSCNCPKKCKKQPSDEDDCCGIQVSTPCYECPCASRRGQCSNIVPWDQCPCQVNWNRPYACPSPYAYTQLASIRRLQWYLAQGFRILQLLNQTLPCLAQQGSSYGGGYPLWGPQGGYPTYPLWGPAQSSGYVVPQAPGGYAQPPKQQGYVTPGYPVPQGGYALPPSPGGYAVPQPGPYAVPQPGPYPPVPGYDVQPGGSDWRPPSGYPFPQPGPYDPSAPYQGGPQQQQPQPGQPGYQPNPLPPLGQGATQVQNGPLQPQGQQQEFGQSGQSAFGVNAQQAPGAPQPLRAGPANPQQSSFAQFGTANTADRTANRPPKAPRFYDSDEGEDRRAPTRPPRSSPAKPPVAEHKQTSAAMPSTSVSIVGTLLALLMAMCVA